MATRQRPGGGTSRSIELGAAARAVTAELRGCSAVVPAAAAGYEGRDSAPAERYLVVSTNKINKAASAAAPQEMKDEIPLLRSAISVAPRTINCNRRALPCVFAYEHLLP